jgi:hypothetical protein
MDAKKPCIIMAVNATYCSANTLLLRLWQDGIDSAYTGKRALIGYRRGKTMSPKIFLKQLAPVPLFIFLLLALSGYPCKYRAVLSVWSTGEI